MHDEYIKTLAIRVATSKITHKRKLSMLAWLHNGYDSNVVEADLVTDPLWFLGFTAIKVIDPPFVAVKPKETLPSPQECTEILKSYKKAMLSRNQDNQLSTPIIPVVTFSLPWTTPEPHKVVWYHYFDDECSLKCLSSSDSSGFSGYRVVSRAEISNGYRKNEGSESSHG